MSTHMRRCVICIQVLVLLIISDLVLAFQDPLDTPAIKHPLAMNSPFFAADKAGERIVIVGQRGHIFYTDDDGRSWSQAEVPVSSDLTDVSFASAAKGWAVGHDGVILHSEDGGESWIRQFDGRNMADLMSNFKEHVSRQGYSVELMQDYQFKAERFGDEGADNPFLSVCFMNEKDGFAVGTFGLLFRTSDGGNSWVSWIDRAENEEQLHLTAIKKVGSDVYAVGERGLVLRLDEEQERFVNVSVDYNGTLFGLTGGDDALLVFGLRGNLFRTTDAGNSWMKVDSGISATLNAGVGAGGGKYRLVSQAGDVLVSTDGGTSFAPDINTERFAATDALLTPGGSFLMVGPRGVHVSHSE